MAEILPECPNCHQTDKVEKVSAIVAEGFSTTPEEGAEPYPWAGQTYYIHYKVQPKESEIGAKSEFKTPNGKTLTKKTIYSWDMGFRERVTKSPLADRLLPKLEKPKPPADITKSMGCFNLFLWPFLLRRLFNWVYRNMEADYTHKLLKLEEAQAKWAKLYYCYRCEGVFTPDSGFVRVWEMNNVLFDLNPNRWATSRTNSAQTRPPQKGS
jgi:hypothetical protein